MTDFSGMPRLCVVVAIVLTTGLLSADATHAKRQQAETYIQLKRSLRGNAKARASTLRRFAKDERAPIGERIQAANALRRELAGDDKALMQTYLLQAHLHGLADEEKNRQRALKRARAAAAKSGDKRREKLLAEIVALEPQIDLLVNRTKTRERKRGGAPLGPADRKLRETIEAGLEPYKQLKDDWQHARIRLWLVRHAATEEGGRSAGIAALGRMVRVGGRRRDLAPLRAEIRRTRARWMAREGEWPEAVHESLVADRAHRTPISEAAFEKSDSRYIKSKQTARLCFRAEKKAGIRCADIERERMGGLTFYDFSHEAGGRAFDDAGAELVANVYSPLLEDCVRASAKTGETRGTNIQIEWAIEHDGKVGGLQVNPRRLRGGAFSKCIKEALTWFRYPPYGGEQKHQGLSFSVGE